MFLEISLENLRYNVRSLKARLFGADLIAVVKANAYGHGAVKIAKAISDEVSGFAVANESEARELVQAGINSPIIVLGTVSGCILPDNVVPTVSDIQGLKSVVGKCKNIAIAVNTGMNRHGCAANEAVGIVRATKAYGIGVRYAYTHIADETDKRRCDKQLSDFIRATTSLDAVKSAAATCAANLGREFCLDAVRVGIGLYGYGAPDLKAVESAYAPVAMVRKVKRGKGIGYGNFIADRDMTVAVVAAGYADGLMRRYGKLFAAINGIKCPAIGKICMDASFFDVGGVNCNIGDNAYFLGRGAEMRDLCDCYDTIPYEILTSFDRRSSKTYV